MFCLFSFSSPSILFPQRIRPLLLVAALWNSSLTVTYPSSSRSKASQRSNLCGSHLISTTIDGGCCHPSSTCLGTVPETCRSVVAAVIDARATSPSFIMQSTAAATNCQPNCWTWFIVFALQCLHRPDLYMRKVLSFSYFRGGPTKAEVHESGAFQSSELAWRWRVYERILLSRVPEKAFLNVILTERTGKAGNGTLLPVD